MSSGASMERCEPNLTPMLDMVLQLVMFFMLCANFVMEQVNETIKLPSAIEAKSLDKSANDYLILNVNPQGKVLLGREDTEGALDNRIKIKNYMKNQFDVDKARTKPALWAAGQGRSIVIIRAHKDCTFKMVYEVMQACRDAGYSNIQLRTLKAVPQG